MPSIFDNDSTNNQSNTSSGSASNTSPELEQLKHIAQVLEDMLKESRNTSQQSVKDRMQSRDDFRSKQTKESSYKNSSSKSGKDGNKSGKFFDELENAFWKQMKDGFVGSDFDDRVKAIMEQFASDIGVSVQDIPKSLGEELGKKATDAIKNNSFIKDQIDKVNSQMQQAADAFKSAYSKETGSDWSKYSESMKRSQEARASRTQSGTTFESSSSTSGFRDDLKNQAKEAAADKMKDKAADSMKDFLSGAGSKADDVASAAGMASKAGSTAANAAGAGKVLSGLGAGAKAALGPLSKLGPQALAAGAALVAIDLASEAVVKVLKWTFAPALESAAEFGKTLGNTFDRANDESERNLRLANERFQADVESIIREPFEILKDAAQEVYDAWDKNVRLINGTQGYTKSDLQDLLASFSQRLRDEGLSSVVSSVDITESLAKVLESGLSGKAAEEFAYQATVLGAAIPNQHFYNYASTYASIVANATQAGMDQASALEYANEQLQAFASNVLYSSRVLSNGVTTGLQDAQKLFEQATQISQAAGTNNSAQISAVLTAVSSYVGGVAPDLASSLTDAIYKAATGGNSSEIVALRSLAGINASNTEFLQQLAKNPQSVFSEMFKNLGDMQKMSEDNYMEVAEGLSQIFGVSMDAFARIDFNQLATAISNMNISNASLEENLKLLASGETTTNQEQLRMQQINKYLIDEGLSYVMDNEVARAIQEHMWDEQIARELMDAQYAVELKGDALEFLEGIRHTIDNIMTILNPFKLVGKLVDVIKTADDAKELTADIQGVLEAGKVGEGNQAELMNLITRNRDLNLTPDIITLLGGTSQYNSPDAFLDAAGALTSLSSGLGSIADPDVFYGLKQSAFDAIKTGMNQSKVESPSSVYSWGASVGKSIATYLSSSVPSGTAVGASMGNVAQSSSDAAKARNKANIDRMLAEDYMQRYIEDGTYEEWKATAKNFGIADFEKALEDAGYTEEAVKARFQSGEANEAARKQAERYQREELFWDNTEAYLVELNEHALEMIDLQTYANEMLDTIYAKETEFYDAWVDYFVKHTAYSAAYDHTDVSRVQREEVGKSSDAVYALAEALTKNSVDLLDPTVQTNALLSQILLVVNAIMQQNNKAGSGTSLPDALEALATGLVKST